MEEHHLSNTDFRKLVETRRHEVSDAKVPNGTTITNAEFCAPYGFAQLASHYMLDGFICTETPEQAEERKAKKALASTKKKQRLESYQKWQDKLAAKQAEQNKYRDRAKERRTGGAADYKELEQYEHVDAQTSKYLGGVVERTHLVKGLDEALLQKVKDEAELMEEEKLEQAYKKKQTTEKGPAGKKVRDQCSAVLSVV